MIFRFSDNLTAKQVQDLASRIEKRQIIKMEYENQSNENYFTLKFDDETKLTIFYETGKGSLILGEGFP